MSLNEKGLSCAGCKAYLFEEDDIVYCPVCGAPHHRECYNRTGHCALEELHGTENEYDAEKAARPVAEEKSESENAPKEPPTTSAAPNSAILQFMEEHEKRSKRSR